MKVKCDNKYNGNTKCNCQYSTPFVQEVREGWEEQHKSQRALASRHTATSGIAVDNGAATFGFTSQHPVHYLFKMK